MVLLTAFCQGKFYLQGWAPQTMLENISFRKPGNITTALGVSGCTKQQIIWLWTFARVQWRGYKRWQTKCEVCVFLICIQASKNTKITSILSIYYWCKDTQTNENTLEATLQWAISGSHKQSTIISETSTGSHQQWAVCSKPWEVSYQQSFIYHQ